ncbi:hypothetical protein Q7P37_002056 [Cladosporium fusiforme]
MESSGAGAHAVLATPTPVPQPLSQNDVASKVDFDSMAWLGLDEAGTTPAQDNNNATSLLQSPFNDTFVANPFQSSNVRQSIDFTAGTGTEDFDQPIAAPENFSTTNQDVPAVADSLAPPLAFDASMDTNNLESVRQSQEPENFVFDDDVLPEPAPAPEASQAVSEFDPDPEPEKPDIAEMNGFAQLSFQDGEFLVTSTQIILGRDDKFAKRYHQEQKLAKRRLKEGSRQAKEVEAQEALHQYQQEPSQPSAHGEEPSSNESPLEGRPARGLASAYSEQGGIVGLPEEEKRRRRRNKKRRNLLFSGQSSSTTSVAPANLHTFRYDLSPGPDDDTEDVQKPVFLPVHPNNPADIKLISREHLQIGYNGQNSRWELTILGRSAYVKNEHYHVEVEGAESWEECEPKLLARDEVAILTHLTEIIVASLRLQFRLPRNKGVVSTFDSDSELSDAPSSPTRPVGGDISQSDSSDEDDAPLQSIKDKKLKKQKKQEKAKAGKKPVILSLKKRKNSEVSPAKPAPVTPKKADKVEKVEKTDRPDKGGKGKRPKKAVAAEPEPEPQPEVQAQPEVQETKETPKQPMQLHLPPPPTPAQVLEQESDHGLSQVQAHVQAESQQQQQQQYQQPHGHYQPAPSETPASVASGGYYAPQQPPSEPVAFEPGSMLSEVPMDQLPEKRKGPGRPPKNGLISKRDMGIIRRKQKEFEKQGIPVPPLDELVRIVRTENKAKEAAAKAAARGEAPPPMAQNFPIMQSIEVSQEPSSGGATYVPAVPTPIHPTLREGDFMSADAEAKGSPKRQRTYRSPSPMKSKEECTEEELKKPNHTYYTTLDEILSEGPPEGLELQQIYDKICKKYPYYKYGVDGHGWQSSVRHNLKQHDRFQQVTKQGKGWLWAINQDIPFDKEKKRKPTPPPVQRPPMPYPMPNGMPPQPGMQQYGNPYAYGQPMPNGQPPYQQAPGQPGQQYASPYGQPSQQPYAQPGAPQQYVPAGGQPPANPQYAYQAQPQQQQQPPPQQPPYQQNGAPQAPVPARTTPTGQRQGSGTPHPQPGFSNLVDEIMAYRSNHLRPYAHLQHTPLYKEQEDVFKKCVEWISELQCNGTPQLNFQNDQERRVFTDLERIMRKYQNPAPTSAPAPAASNTQQPDSTATAGAQTAQAPQATAGAQVPPAPAGGAAPSTAPNVTMTDVDSSTAGTKRSAPEDGDGTGNDGSDPKRMKVEGEVADQGVSTSVPQAYTATAGPSAQQPQPNAAPNTQDPAMAMDTSTSQSAAPPTDPVFDFSNPSGPHDPQDPVFDFSTPDPNGEQPQQPVFDFSQPAVVESLAAPAEQMVVGDQAQVPVQQQGGVQTQQQQQQQFSQPQSNVQTQQQQHQQFSQPPPSNVQTPQPQQYSQPPATSQSAQTMSVQQQQQQQQQQPQAQPPYNASTTQPQSQPQSQVYSQPPSQAPSVAPSPQLQQYSQPPSQNASVAPSPQPQYSQAPSQVAPQAPNVAPSPQLQQYSQAPSQTASVAPSPQAPSVAPPAQTQQYSQAPSQPASVVPSPQPQQYSQPPAQTSNAALPPPPQQYASPAPQVQGTAPLQQPQQPYAQQPTQVASVAPPQQPQAYTQSPQQPMNVAPVSHQQQQQQPYSQPPSRPASAVQTPQPQPYSRPPSRPTSTVPTPQPAQAYSQPPSRPQSAAPTPQPAQSYAQPPLQPPGAAPTPQPVQSFQQPPAQNPSALSAPQQAQSHAHPASQPPSAVPTSQPVQNHSQTPTQPPSAAPTPQPQSQPPSAAPTPPPVQSFAQPPSQPPNAVSTPQPVQAYQPPQQPSNATPAQQVQQGSSHPTPSHTPAPAPSTPAPVEHALETTLPVATSEHNTPSGPGGNNTPAPQS